MKRKIALFSLAALSMAHAGEHFIEAESFASPDGWSVVGGTAAKQASGLKMLNGAQGSGSGAATAKVDIKDSGYYRIWVRYSSHPVYRGPFHVTVLSGGRVLGDGLFDDSFQGKGPRDTETWKYFEAELPEGEVVLKLSKHEDRNCPGAARNVDCLLLTMDEKVVPNHLNYGAQTYLRVTLGAGYGRPAYIHVFADHYHAPWYQHYSLGRGGAVSGTSPGKRDLIGSGESTGWCNITPMIYQDSGAMLHLTARHGYTDYAGHLSATFEIATEPDEKHIVRTLKTDNRPGTVSIFFPPNLLTEDNRALCKTDREIADAIGTQADAHEWPVHGKARTKFPFFVTANIDNKFTPPDDAVREREQRTLGYFGFSDEHLRRISGAWLMKDRSYCNPDLDRMRAKIEDAAAAFKKDGGKVEKIVFSELTDEPTGQELEFMANDPSYAAKFIDWLKSLRLTPADLLINGWEEAKIVTAAQRDRFPALYLYSQRFRTRALGDFMDAQHRMIRQAYGGDFPVLANFSDGAVYAGNFCAQGVDYFELMRSPGQNAIWGEDWSNGSSTYQCASFNVDLMRAATSDRGQIIGHHLVSHAGRKAWDIKLKATSELARGVKIFNSFCYGPVWATHEGGPYWRSHVWQGRPETWSAHAAITREVGAAEDMLLTAMPAPARIALLYSSSSDAWTIGSNLAFGFDRMHTWLALTHAQMPVDVISEQQAADGALDRYSVCYLSGPNLSRAAANKLTQWVKSGGTLWLTAAAGSRDEFNRPLQSIDRLLPATRGELITLQAHSSSGRYLAMLSTKDEVSWKDGRANVLSVKQSLTSHAGANTIATFKDGSPALVNGPAGKGAVYCAGFLPAISYIKSALDARAGLQRKIDDKTPLDAGEQADAELIERSYNPWKYPADVRELILLPSRVAGIAPPIKCNVPLVDAVFMPHDHGILIPLANYTLRKIDSLTLKVSTPRPVTRIMSATLGDIRFTNDPQGTADFSLPLENNDFLMLHFR